MKSKIKAIIKRPDEQYGHSTWISPKLENFQNTVGGYIETVQLPNGVVCICNEEGKLKGLEENMRIPGDVLVGTIILCGTSGEDFGDIPITFAAWKQYCDVCARG